MSNSKVLSTVAVQQHPPVPRYSYLDSGCPGGMHIPVAAGSSNSTREVVRGVDSVPHQGPLLNWVQLSACSLAHYEFPPSDSS